MIARAEGRRLAPIYASAIVLFVVLLSLFYLLSFYGPLTRIHESTMTDQDEDATVFTQVIARKLPADIIYEDDLSIAIKSLHPKAPVHFLVIPKEVIPKLSEAEDRHQQLLGHLMLVARKVAKQEKLENGFRLVVNDGDDGGQAVYHLHIHILGGRGMMWPPG